MRIERIPRRSEIPPKKKVLPSTHELLADGKTFFSPDRAKGGSLLGEEDGRALIKKTEAFIKEKLRSDSFREIVNMIHPDKASENITLNLQTGLPKDDDESFDFDVDGPNFTLPFHLEFGNIVLQVYLHKV